MNKIETSKFYMERGGGKIYNTDSKSYNGLYYCKFCGKIMDPEYGYEEYEKIGPYYECYCKEAIAEKKMIDKCNEIMLSAQLEIRRLETEFSKNHQPNINLVKKAIYEVENNKLQKILGVTNVI